MYLGPGVCGVVKEHLALQNTPANQVGLPGMLPPCPRRCPLLLAVLAGCPAQVLACQQLQCCRPLLAIALQVAKNHTGTHYQGSPQLYRSAHEASLACSDGCLSTGTRCPNELLSIQAAKLVCSAVSNMGGMLHALVARLKSS